MNRSEYEAIELADPKEPMLVASTIPGPDRTLIYGYTVDRDTWHVYLADGAIHLLVTRGTRPTIVNYRKFAVATMAELVPNKRTYPENCDAWVARAFAAEGVSLNFTNFRDDKLPRGPFASWRRDELIRYDADSYLDLCELIRKGSLIARRDGLTSFTIDVSHRIPSTLDDVLDKFTEAGYTLHRVEPSKIEVTLP